jgi:restriction endonuclease S subunit
LDKHSFPNGKRLVRDTLKPDDNLHYEQFQDGTINEYENELPFEIPSKWVWCNLGMLFSHNTGKALNASKTDGVSLTYITTSNVYWNSFELDNLKIMPFTDSEIEKCTVKKGDLLVCEGGDIGRAAIWQFENEIRIQNHLHRLRPYDRIYTKFYYYIMYLYKANGRINGNGIGLQGLSSNALHNIIVPVPPVEEQKRIVDSIDSVLSLIEQIESHKQNLSSQIDNIKSKILDLAIRGKLVAQDPNDEPASVLLERIRAEKEELIKQGKIKRDKKESVIFKGSDNSYYQDLPKMWELVNFKDCATLISGRDLNKNEYNAESIGIPYITGASNFINGNILINRWTTVPKTISEVNDILITCKGTVGELAINKYGNIHIARQIMAIRIYKNINLEYIKFFLESIVMEIKKTANGLIPGISRDDILSLNIPLPSLTEQKRIVDEIEKIFATLDDIANQVA